MLKRKMSLSIVAIVVTIIICFRYASAYHPVNYRISTCDMDEFDKAFIKYRGACIYVSNSEQQSEQAFTDRASPINLIKVRNHTCIKFVVDMKNAEMDNTTIVRIHARDMPGPLPSAYYPRYTCLHKHRISVVHRSNWTASKIVAKKMTDNKFMNYFDFKVNITKKDPTPTEFIFQFFCKTFSKHGEDKVSWSCELNQELIWCFHIHSIEALGTPIPPKTPIRITKTSPASTVIQLAKTTPMSTTPVSFEFTKKNVRLLVMGAVALSAVCFVYGLCLLIIIFIRS